MSSFSLLHSSYIASDVVSAASVSSENATYLAENVYNYYRRSKKWRSAGCWEIESGSNTIIFEETLGVNLTATVAAATYTTTAAFIAALAAAFDAAGASTYTVTQAAGTNKIKITSDGLGGGGIFKIEWTHADSADMAGILGFSTTADDSGALNYTADTLKIHTSEWFKWDLGVSSNPKAFVMMGDRASALAISPSATITLQGHESDVWTAPSYEQVLTFNESAIVLFDGDGLHTESLRFWRVVIEDQSNPVGYVELQIMYLGDGYQPTRGRVQFPLSVSLVDTSTVVTLESGRSLGNSRPRLQKFTANWAGLTSSELEELADIFETQGLGTPFIVVMDPDAAFSSSSSYHTRLVRFESLPSHNLVSPNNFTLAMTLKEEI